MRQIAGAAALAIIAQPALADLSVRFLEGAPKDRFIITSEGGVCADGPVSIVVDMSGSAGALIFDVTGEGAGVEVYQPFELVSGGTLVSGASRVVDGDSALQLDLETIAPGTEVAFTIDVDDTIGAREITVTGSEISGAIVRVVADGDVATGTFDDSARAVVPWPSCLS